MESEATFGEITFLATTGLDVYGALKPRIIESKQRAWTCISLRTSTGKNRAATDASASCSPYS